MNYVWTNYVDYIYLLIIWPLRLEASILTGGLEDFVGTINLSIFLTHIEPIKLQGERLISYKWFFVYFFLPFQKSLPVFVPL